MTKDESRITDHASRIPNYESNPIRVMIVDDHGMVRRGLTAYLRNETDLELVGEARDGQEAVVMCAQVQPHVILMDLVMPELGGAAATRSPGSVPAVAEASCIANQARPTNSLLQTAARGYASLVKVTMLSLPEAKTRKTRDFSRISG